jgi:hypothetical protein
MSDETKLLAHLLQCGYADVSYFCELLEDFNIEDEELDLDNYGDGLHVNQLIAQVFQIVCERHNIEECRYSIFTNCLDSHLYIDGDKMYKEDDVISKVTPVEETEE